MHGNVHWWHGILARSLMAVVGIALLMGGASSLLVNQVVAGGGAPPPGGPHRARVHKHTSTPPRGGVFFFNWVVFLKNNFD